jgi:hypothetical protein
MSANWVDDGADKYIANGFASRYLQIDGAHRWATASSGSSGGALSFTDAMTLDASGNLLLGTTTGTNAVATLGNNNGSSGFGYQKYSAFFGTNLAGSINPTNSWGLSIGWNRSNGGGESNIVYGTGSGSTPGLAFASWDGSTYTERARITAAGDVLFGTTTLPSAGSGGSAFRVDTEGRRNLYLSTQSTGNNGLVYFLNPNGEIGSITTNGSATSYNTSSDARLKENITDSEDAGNKIDTIQVRQFDWKADGAHQSYGMIAQELMTVAPEAVSGDPESNEMMGVDYSKLIPMLVKEVQSLRKRVAELEAK